MDVRTSPRLAGVVIGARRELPLQFGSYEVCGKIADGGMAAVYVARRVGGPSAGEWVALKTIREEFERRRDFVTMFEDEAHIVAHLRHPNVVHYYELVREGRQVFLAMELLSGQSLWNVWQECRARRIRLPYDLIAWMGARVADGLHHAHELSDEGGRRLDVVHRDVNATNIVLTYAGEIKVIDFGLAKASGRASKTAAGVIKGKAAYMSPEQAIGAPVDRRTDVFALGTTLWELACDRRLFRLPDEDETLRRVYAAHVPDPTRIVDGFPPAFAQVLARSLARLREHRYPTAADFARDLDRVALEMREAASSERETVDGAPRVAGLLRELFPEEARAPLGGWAASAPAAAPSAPTVAPPAPPDLGVDASASRAMLWLRRAGASTVQGIRANRAATLAVVILALLVGVLLATK